VEAESTQPIFLKELRGHLIRKHKHLGEKKDPE